MQEPAELRVAADVMEDGYADARGQLHVAAPFGACEHRVSFTVFGLDGDAAKASVTHFRLECETVLLGIPSRFAHFMGGVRRSSSPDRRWLVPVGATVSGEAEKPNEGVLTQDCNSLPPRFHEFFTQLLF